MEKRWRTSSLLIATLFCLAITSRAEPTCKSCRGVGGPFVEGNVYKYQLEGSTTTTLPGSDNAITTLGLSATAEVFAESKCQHVLKLSNVVVSGPDGKKYDGLSAECAKPVKFSYQDGKLLEVCAEAEDRGAALNIKRAVISLLSSAKRSDQGTESGHENDVFGICPTEFSFSKDGSKVTIHKTRNLNRCALREDFNFPFPTTAYQAVQSSFGALETSPLLGAQLTVDQELEGGVLKKAAGEEVYVYRPLVNPEAGAKVTVKYTLALQGSGAGSIPANVNSPKVVFYEKAHDADGVKNADAINAALQKATAAVEPVATAEAAKSFAHLVYTIEQGSKADILQVYNGAQGKTAKNLFLDGLLYAGSAESVEAAAELLSSQQISADAALRWYLDLNFVKHTSRGSLKALLPLLASDKVPVQAYLGIGSVAGKFYLQHPSLADAPELKELLTKLAAPLDAGCKTDSHDKENKIIASLKGLRNTRHLSDDVAAKVAACASDKTAKTRVRVAAIEAFFADPAKSALKQAATAILKDVEEDSELRIKAYLALVQAPCPHVADTVKQLVDSEPINQVGSFVISHLRNLRASVSPEKEAAKQFLGNIISKKKFPIDQRKFSRNYEVSYSLDAINVGAVGELNRIFSQKSFIPRSVSLNLTTQLFGHSLNLAEVGVRMENLEYHLEKYFGPKGLLKSRGIKFVDKVGDDIEEAVKKVKDAANRPKRSVSKEQASAATNKIELGPDYEDLDTDLDLSVKLFGSDIAWFNYHYNRLDVKGLKQKLHGEVEQLADKSKALDIDYKKARQFLDVGVSYPTGLGLALKVKVSGNSAVNIKVKGNVDLKAIYNHPDTAHVALQVVPSANVELASLLSVDADVVETGVKVSANLHSSTGSDITVKVLDGYGVDVKLGLPVKKQDILNFNSDVVSIVREKKGGEVESPIKFDVKRQDHGGCFDQLSALTGLTVCGEVSLPMEGFKVLSPAYGPSRASLRLEKDDESLTAYHFKAFYNNKEPNQVTLEVLLDTPNSKTSRKFGVHVHGTSKPQKQITVTLASPFKQASFEGLVIDTDNEQAISAKLLADGAEYSLKAGAHVSGDGNKKKYEPILEYKYPEAAKSERAWIGRKGAAKGGRTQQSSVGVTGAVFVEKKPDSPYRKYELKAVTLTTPRIKVTVDGVVTVDADLVATDLKASYDKDSYTLNSKVQKLGESKYIAKIEFVPSQYPDFGASVKWEYERVPHKLENKLVVVHGPDLKSETSRLSIQQLLNYKYETVKVFDFHTENTVTYPLLGISASVKGGATPKSADYDIDVTYDKTNVKSKLDAKSGGKNPLDYSVDFEAAALGNSVHFISKHDRVTPTKSKFANSLEIKPGGKYQLNAISEFNAKSGDFLQSLDAELKMPQDPKNIKLKTKVEMNNKENEIELAISAGNKHIIDFEYERQKKIDPSGKFKLSVPKYVESEGSFEAKADKLSGVFHVDILKTGRKIEGKVDLTKSQSQVKGFGEVLWDSKKDPSKKIHIETDTTIAGKTIDSKNTVQVLEHKGEVNVKGSLEGSLTDGTLIGDAEVVLPNGRVLAAKVNRLVHLGPEDNKVEGTWELYDFASKSAQPRKVVLKIAAKNVNPVKVQFDGQVDLTYVTPEKQDVVLHVVGKKIPQAEKWSISGQGSVTGSLIKYPIHTKLNAEVSDQLIKGQLTADKKFPPAHYDFELKAGNDIAINSNGKVNGEQLNNDIELTLPADLPVTSVKWHTANTVNIYHAGEAGRKVVTNNAVHWNNDKFVKFNVEGAQKEQHAEGKVVWESHVLSARTLTYKVNCDDKKQKGEVDLALAWEGKNADVNVKADVGSNPVHLTVTSNVPEHGKFELDAYHKIVDGGESGETSISASGKDKKLVYTGKYSKSKTAPYIDVSLELPQGKSRFYTKLEKKGEQHALVEAKLLWPAQGGGSLDLNGEVNVKSLDSFLVKLFVDSPKLSLNKMEFEAANQPAKSAAKQISFHGKNGDKEISGNLALVSKGTAPNIHYEGTGVLKVGETSYPLEFKLKTEHEKGKKLQNELEVKAGKYSYSSHTLVEIDEALNSFKLDSDAKYCKEEGCKADSIKMHSHRKGFEEYEATSEAKLDMLTHIVLDNPLVIKSHYKRTGWNRDNLLEVENGADKLKYHSYIKDDQSGVELTLPKRTIAVESVYDLAKGGKPAFKIETNFWLDKKNNPNDKTGLLLAYEATKVADGVSTSSEAKFNTPGLKELTVKGDFNVNLKDRTIQGKLEADVFAKKNQKIVVDYKAVAKKDKDSYNAHDTLHIHSKALPIDSQIERKFELTKQGFSYFVTAYYVDSKNAKRESVVKFNIKPLSQDILVKLPEGTIFSLDYDSTRNGKEIHGKAKSEIVGQHYEEEFDLKPYRLKSKSSTKNGDKSGVLDVDVGAELGQLAEVNLKFNSKPLLSLEVALDEAHFLKSKHSYNTDVAKEIIQFYKDHYVGIAKSANKIGKDSAAKLATEVTEKVEAIRKALPNFKPAVEHYKKELDQMKEEFKSNEHVKDVVDFLKRTFGTVFAQISAIVQEAVTSGQHLLELLNQGLERITQSVKATIPKLKESYEKVSETVFAITDDLLKVITSLVDSILDKIKEHEKEIQELTDVISDFFHDMGKLGAVSVGELHKQVKDFVTTLWEQIQAMPAYNMIQEKIQELKNFKIPQQYWDTYHELVTSATNFLPTPELQEFVKTASEYFEKIVKQQPFNKQEAAQELYKEFVAAARSLVPFLESYKPDTKTGAVPSFLFPIPSFSLFVAPPGTFRFSLLNWVRSSDLPTLSEVFHTYRPQHSPLDFIPPFYASAQLLGGTEFFTFDKKHYSFKGSCSYVLSTDALDSNFTIVANMEGGKLKSITVFDHENSVELQHDDTVLVNGQPADLPVSVGDLNMWRKFDSGTGFATYSGLMFFCTPHLQTCAFSINGYYFGKTRGLLGTYNNEPYDDTLLPQGKLAKSTAEFANSWKVSPQCADGAVHDSPAAPQPECDKLFAGDSSLRGCFSYENPDRFREACNRQVAEASGDAKQERACNIAQSYTGYCYYVHFVRTNLPDHCGKCQVGSQSIQIGESAPVKTPQKEADIVFVVEQLEDNQEVFNNLVTPLVSTLTNDLKEKGITDVNFALVGYGAPNQKWPAVYTFNGKFNQFPGTAKNIHFDKKPEVENPKLSDKIEEIFKKIQIETGMSKAAQAFKEAFQYPFRPEATKTVIGILSSECEKNVLPFRSLNMLIHRVNLLKAGISTNLVLPIKDLRIEGKDEKVAANIVGFDSETVYTQSEAKRKVLKGDEEAFKNLKYENEACIDFALGTNGAVFSSSNFVKGKPQLRKNFMQVVANKIAEELTSQELREECKCELERGMLVRTRCKVTGRKEKEALTKGVKGGVKG
ncbi:apolipophorins-like [Macrosteles quadrilineatus]|uniref:apolipophorins-like n=1 Tax=Macrosteles quadrilineatus TaxID=74068 RepID=UPI0023E21ECD|nr:apolipophorins-like [Macrosteles quadrilineatus]